MKALRKSFPAVGSLLVAGFLVIGATSALAVAPYPTGGQATAVVSGTPLVQAVCPTIAPAMSSGTSTAGVATATGAGAQCTGAGSSAAGQYAITGATAAAPTSLRFSAQCINSSGATNGLADVPAGTTVPGLGVVAAQTEVTANVTVTYPGGTTAILNSVATTATSVTRTAIQITSGPGAGTVIGRAVCGTPFPYPLAVDVPSAGAAADVALTPVSADGGSSASRTLLVGGAVGLLLLAQVAVGRNVWRRRRNATGH